MNSHVSFSLCKMCKLLFLLSSSQLESFLTRETIFKVIYFESFFENGPIPASFCLICYFHVTISIIQIEKSIVGVLRIRTRGCRMVGTDKTTELWCLTMFFHSIGNFYAIITQPFIAKRSKFENLVMKKNSLRLSLWETINRSRLTGRYWPFPNQISLLSWESYHFLSNKLA